MAAAIAALSGCVPVAVNDRYWDQVPATSEGQAAAKPSDQLQLDDTVRVMTREGDIHVYRVYKLEKKAFYGADADGKKFRVGYAALTSLEVLRDGSTVRLVPLPLPASNVGGPDISVMSGASSGGGGSFGFGPLLMLGAALLGRRRPR